MRRHNGHSYRVLATLLLVPMTGCVALKNPVPPAPQSGLVSQWQTRYSRCICVRTPMVEDFEAVTNKWERQSKFESAQREARRLAEILSNCRLFEDLIMSDNLSTNALVIEALPNA